MRVRGIFLADGRSDLPLADHLVRLCSDHGAEVELTVVDPDQLAGTTRTVEARLRFLRAQGAVIDIAFIHRDAEAQELLSDGTRRSQPGQ